MHKLKYSDDSDFKSAVELLDKNGNGVLPIIDNDNKLLGIVTDGDIRRSILNNTMTLNETINFNPITLPSSTSRKEAIAYLNKIHRRHIPLVDGNGKLIEVIILDDFEVHGKPNWVVLMVGGLGSRLGKLTEETPKPMLAVGDKPLLENIVDSFKAKGFLRFIFCVNYKSHIIENYFGNGERFGVSIKYTKERMRMGTAGALSLIEPDLFEHPFIVSNGDILTTIDFEDALKQHNNQDSKASLLIKQHHHVVQYATVSFDEDHKLLTIHEKPTCTHYINSGIYILDPTVLKLVPKNEFVDMPDLISELIRRKDKVSVIKTEEYWLDVGHPDEYKKANKDIEKQ